MDTTQAAAQDYSEGASEPVPGAVADPSALSAQDLLSLEPMSPARPYWQVESTRFPVPMEEYARLNEAARQPDAAAALAAVDATTADEDAAAEAAGLEAPEGQSIGEYAGGNGAGVAVAGVAVAPGAAPAALAPALTANFEGIPQTAFRPPDCTAAAGPNHILVAVNADLSAYSKAGALQFHWADMNPLFGGVRPAGSSLFDPRVAYDPYDQRWIVIAVARRETPRGSWLMVAASQTANPAGAYWVWVLDASLNGSTPTGNWMDYPMLGIDTQAIYVAANMFQFSGGFQYAKLRILRKAEVYGGGVGPSHTIRWYDFWNLKNPDNSLAFTVQPAMHFRGTGGNPPAYLANALWPAGRSLTLWTLANPIGFWIGGSASLSRVAVPCRDYDLPPDAQQQGSSVRIETNDSRLLNAVYQFTGGVQRLWTCHTSKHTWPGDAEARSVAQWYEIDIPSKTVVQQNRYGASGKYYFFPAIHTDAARNAFVVLGRSSSGEFAQLRQTGRRVTDPPNDLQNSALVKAGEGSYTQLRWGDYFGIARDGGNPATVWMYGEYADTGNVWATRVCAARF